MDRETRQATVCGIAKSDTTERLTLLLLILHSTVLDMYMIVRLIIC